MNQEFEKFKAYIKSELLIDLKQLMDENEATIAQGIVCMIEVMRMHGLNDTGIVNAIYQWQVTSVLKSPEAALEIKTEYDKLIKEKMKI